MLLAGKAVVLVCMLGPLLVITDGAAARAAALTRRTPLLRARVASQAELCHPGRKSCAGVTFVHGACCCDGMD